MFSFSLNTSAITGSIRNIRRYLYFGGSLHYVVSNGDTAVNIAALDLKSVPTQISEPASSPTMNIYPNPAMIKSFLKQQIRNSHDYKPAWASGLK
jgi:hypothetical protein